MEIKRFKQALPYIFKSKVSTLIWGFHGVGKSEAVKQYCADNNYKYFDIRLGSVEVGDLLGLADFQVNDKGEKVATKFFTPDWLKDLINYCNNNPKSKAVVFMDELNRGRRDVLQAVFQMVLDHKHNTVDFPPNMHVIAASNPNTEGYIVADISDEAFMDRFLHIKLSPSAKEWIDYAEDKTFERGLINFIKAQPELLDSMKTDFELERKPSRRSWAVINRLMQNDTPMDILQELAFGLVGKPATIAFMESLRAVDKPIPAKEILDHYDKYDDKVKEYSDPKTGGRADLIKVTCDELKKVLEKDDKALKDKQAKNLLRFLKTIPAEQTFQLMRELYVLENVRDHLDADSELVAIIQKNTKVG